MILNTLPKKFVLAIILAYGGVIWLSAWHRYGYSRSVIVFPPVSNWLRDSMIILIPVLLVVWVGVALAQWLIDRSNWQMSPSTQSMLMAAILGGMTSLTTILIENNRIIWTGIGNEFVFLASICGRLYPNGNLVLSIMQWIFPGVRALRFHILLQDGLNLMLFNLTITILLVMLIEGFVRARNSYAQETG